MQVEKYNHHGNEVSVQTHLKGKHRDHCLCWQNCKHFTPDDCESNCEIANANFANCVKFKTVQPVWECPKYESIEVN